MSFSAVLKNSLPINSRISYAPRTNFNRNMSHPTAPKTDSLYLSKKCGFSLPFDPDISMEKYLCAVGDLVGDDKMVFAGKNNDLVKIYLTNESEVTKLYENHPQIVIDEKPLCVNKLVDNGHKIFLCNVEPGVSDSMLINELTKYTKVLSPVKFVNLGCRNERFTHLIGFRRTVQVETIEDLPPSFSLYYDNTTYKIFVVIDKVKCFNCNAEGHLVKNCTVKHVSVQERIDPTSPGYRAPPPRSDTITSTFLPVFASKTATTVVTPIPDASYSSNETQVAELPAASDKIQVQVQEEVISPDLTPPQDPKATVIAEVVIENKTTTVAKDPVPPPAMPMETNQDICKKRAHDQSPPPTANNDKKQCVSTKSELQCLVPIIEECEPSIDATVFVNLVQDLKNSKKKLEVIKDDYDMEPTVVTSVLLKIITDESSTIEPRIKNRLKNLRKALLTLLAPASKSVNATSTNISAVSDSGPVFSDSDNDLSQIG
ncbi:hypothetical protein M8J77_008422 [Diaphorina citri]|nr:hypothetical protein M8J77_008422 [Diaphorina citri]